MRRSFAAALWTGVATLVLTVMPASPASAAFPGRNGLILFNRGGDLYTASASGGSIKRMTAIGGIAGAKWSPDGKRIAYRRNSNIVVRTVATGRSITVAAGAASAPQWSPDGSRIAFIDGLPDAPCGEQGVFSVPSTGGAAPRLDYNPFSDNCPHGTDEFGLGTYMPGGQSILLTTCYGWYDTYCWISEVSMNSGNPWRRMVLEIECSEQSEWPEDGSPSRCNGPGYLHLSDARIGPGGNGVLFSGRGGYEPPTGTLPGSTPLSTTSSLEKVYAIDKSGSGLHRVSTASSGYDATWSPNGGSVLFTQRSGTARNVMKVSGTSATATAQVLIKNASQSDWQPIP